jgi:hypothetical protein
VLPAGRYHCERSTALRDFNRLRDIVCSRHAAVDVHSGLSVFGGGFAPGSGIVSFARNVRFVPILLQKWPKERPAAPWRELVLRCHSLR